MKCGIQGCGISLAVLYHQIIDAYSTVYCKGVHIAIRFLQVSCAIRKRANQKLHNMGCSNRHLRQIKGVLRCLYCVCACKLLRCYHLAVRADNRRIIQQKLEIYSCLHRCRSRSQCERSGVCGTCYIHCVRRRCRVKLSCCPVRLFRSLYSKGSPFQPGRLFCCIFLQRSHIVIFPIIDIDCVFVLVVCMFHICCICDNHCHIPASLVDTVRSFHCQGMFSRL